MRAIGIAGDAGTAQALLKQDEVVLVDTAIAVVGNPRDSSGRAP